MQITIEETVTSLHMSVASLEGHYLIHKHQPHIGTYMGGCHIPAQYVTSLTGLKL